MRVLFHQPISPYSRKVRLVLAEKRLPFELRLEKYWEKRPEYLQLNPAGSVPTLVEPNGLAVADSGNICEYLDEAYPDTPLIGRTVAERVEVRRLVAFCDGVFAAEVTRKVLGEIERRALPNGALIFHCRSGNRTSVHADRLTAKGGDVYVLKSVLHNYGDREASALLRSCRRAMGADARLVIAERVLPERAGTSAGALFDINMLAVTGGRERSLADYAALLAEAGFAPPRLLPTRSPLGLVEAGPA